MRVRRTAALILLICFSLAAFSLAPNANAAAYQADRATTNTNSEPAPFSSPRELLESLGVDASHLEFLVDGEPIDSNSNDQETLLRFLFAVRRFDRGEMERWMQHLEWPKVVASPKDFRGQILHVSGKVRRVSVEKPLPEMGARFELRQYYRCDVTLDGSDLPAIVYTLSVPSAWKLDTDLDERAGCRGFFLKLAGSEANPLPALVAQHMAWYPDNLLGNRGMDFGLFDSVKHRASISAQERECFYQMLAVVGRMPLAELLAQGDGGKASVVPLFNNPQQQVGKLTTLTGTARRAMLVRLDAQRDADIIQRHGFDHYYQVELFTEDSQGNPLVFCLRELPPGMPTGPNIHEAMRIPGFFYKTWAFQTQATNEASADRQLAPMLIGNQAIWLVPPAKQSQASYIAAGLFLVALAGLFAGVWWLNRGDRKFHQATIARQFEPEKGVSLDKLGLEAPNKPDFSGLE